MSPKLDANAKRAAPSCEWDGAGDWLKEGEFAPEMVKRGRVRRSKMGKRRAWVLVLVHVAIFAHILHIIDLPVGPSRMHIYGE